MCRFASYSTLLQIHFNPDNGETTTGVLFPNRNYPDTTAYTVWCGTEPILLMLKMADMPGFDPSGVFYVKGPRLEYRYSRRYVPNVLYTTQFDDGSISLGLPTRPLPNLEKPHFDDPDYADAYAVLFVLPKAAYRTAA